MKNFDSSKWYVWGAGWDAREIMVYDWEPNAVCATEDEAKAEVARLWEEELECDEQVFIYHNGVMGDDVDWWGFEWTVNH